MKKTTIPVFISAIFLIAFISALKIISYGYFESIEDIGITKTGVKNLTLASSDSEKIAPPKNFKVAFFADQGYTKNSIKVLKLVKKEGADMVIHPGDLDYENDPEKWDKMITGILGEKFPYFIARGNHDYSKWSEYQRRFKERLEKLEGIEYEGDLGVKSVVTYKGIKMVLSGGMNLSVHEEYEEYIKDALAADDNYIWEIAVWHKNQRLLQVGDKKDEVGWEIYEAGRREGAIIATGHGHLYARTFLMSSFKDRKVASMSNNMILKKGKTIAFISGLGGGGILKQDDKLARKPWWASIYTKDQNANYGALFITFNPDGERRKAVGYFKNIDGKVIDKFSLTKKFVE